MKGKLNTCLTSNFGKVCSVNFVDFRVEKVDSEYTRAKRIDSNFEECIDILIVEVYLSK